MWSLRSLSILSLYVIQMPFANPCPSNLKKVTDHVTNRRILYSMLLVVKYECHKECPFFESKWLQVEWEMDFLLISPWATTFFTWFHIDLFVPNDRVLRNLFRELMNLSVIRLVKTREKIKRFYALTISWPISKIWILTRKFKALLIP